MNDRDVSEQNVERLLAAYKPEAPDPAYVKRVTEQLFTEAVKHAEVRAPERLLRLRRRFGWAFAVAAAVTGVALVLHALQQSPGERRPQDRPRLAEERVLVRTGPVEGLKPQARSPARELNALALGQSVETKAGERRRMALLDGSVLYINQNTTIKLDAPRHMSLSRGEVFVEVSPLSPPGRGAGGEGPKPFIVQTAKRSITALGTKFAVRAEDAGTGVVVTQGKVRVSGVDNPIVSGQQLALNATQVTPAPRVSHVLDWTKDLMAAAESPLVPGSQYAGGALVARAANGQESRLSLRKFHVDVHVEDGFARTTIDQTYFNHDYAQLEGTFYFPLPADASLSRLAMYVANGSEATLMEGGMAERDYARQVFETIRYARRDPALLEWLDGSTFKMRVFPLEGRQEKRIILSYTQRLPSLYGRTTYRFPAGHSLEAVRDWSFHALMKHGANVGWSSPSRPALTATKKNSDLALDTTEKNIKVDRDVIVELSERRGLPPPEGEAIPPGQAWRLASDNPRFSSAELDGFRYLMVRYRPELPSQPVRQRRDWVFLFESSGDRDPLLARVQINVVRTLLENAEHDDTFAIVACGTRARAASAKPQAATAENIRAATAFLEESHLIGALDLGKALTKAEPFLTAGQNPYLVHVGSGIPVLGERREDALARRIPDGVRYVGVGVGKRWSRNFMKMAADRTGGYFTQINPDEPIGWRAFELASILNTPRLLNVKVVDNAEKVTFLNYVESISQGEEICAIARIGPQQSLPKSIAVTGTLDGKTIHRDVPVEHVAEHADYLPRTWAKLEIDRLLSTLSRDAKESEVVKNQIIALSKAMYVMTPYTSLLVLENEAMYQQYKVDRGRKDHWAMYPCPEKMPVVYEPEQGQTVVQTVRSKLTRPEQVLQTVLVRVPPAVLTSLPQTAESEMQRLQMEVLRLHADLVGRDQHIQSLEASKRAFRDRNVTAELSVKSAEARNEELLAQLETVLGERKITSLASGDTTSRGVRSSGGFEPGFARPFGGGFGPITNGGGGFSGGGGFGGGMLGGGGGMPSGMGGGGGGMMGMGGMGGMGGGPGMPAGTGGGRGLGKGEGGKPGGRRPASAEALPELGAIIISAESEPGLKELLELSRALRVERIQGVDPVVVQKAIDALQGRPGTGDSKSMSGFGGFGSGLGAFREGPRNGSPPAAALPYFNYYNLVQPQSGGKGNNLNYAAFSPDGWWFINDGIERSIRLWDVETGLPSPIQFNHDGAGIQSKDSLLYHRPTFTGDQRIFTDLLAYAPAMNTSRADVLAVLENEASLGSRVALGKVDPAARKLIDRSRSSGWRKLSIAGDDGKPAFTITFDGSGRYAYEQTFATGLQERVICDGKTLLHLYPEIGVGARRTVSRFHRAEFTAFVPWVLPPVEDLARGGDLKCIDEHTVAIIPRGIDKLSEPGGSSPRYARIELVFAADGRLTERRLVEMPSHKILSRETYAVDGTVKLFDADGQAKIVRKGILQATEAPNLKPDTKALVVVPFPLRTRDHIVADKKAASYATLPEETAVALFASNCLGHLDGPAAVQVFGQRFHAKGDRRLGFYTLLAAANIAFNPSWPHPLSTGGQVRLDVLGEHPNQPLAKYLAHLNKEFRPEQSKEMGDVGGNRNSFLYRLAAFHDLYTRWSSGRVQAMSVPDRRVEQRRAQEFVRQNRSNVFGWTLLNVVQARVTEDAESLEALAGSYKEVDPLAGLAYVARYEHARLLQQSGRKPEAARAAFRGLYTEALKEGMLPPIDPMFKQSLGSDAKKPGAWQELIRHTATGFVEKKNGIAVAALAWQCHQLGDNTLADDLIGQAVACSTDSARLVVALSAANYWRQTNKLARASAVLEPLLAEKEYAESSYLWRVAADLAAKRSVTAQAAACLEKALELESRQLPDLIDLQTLRTDYSTLLGHYQTLAAAMKALNQEPAPDFAARVVRAADRWRALDSDDTGACQSAAQILKAVGANDLAWEYLTTPIAHQPNEASPWLGLAQQLRGQADLQLADYAYAAAFAAEPTNAQILFDRAVNLQESGRVDAARPLFRQLADGDWQPRFSGLKDQARAYLQR